MGSHTLYWETWVIEATQEDIHDSENKVQEQTEGRESVLLLIYGLLPARQREQLPRHGNWQGALGWSPADRAGQGSGLWQKPLL